MAFQAVFTNSCSFQSYHGVLACLPFVFQFSCSTAFLHIYHSLLSSVIVWHLCVFIPSQFSHGRAFQCVYCFVFSSFIAWYFSMSTIPLFSLVIAWHFCVFIPCPVQSWHDTPVLLLFLVQFSHGGAFLYVCCCLFTLVIAWHLSMFFLLFLVQLNHSMSFLCVRCYQYSYDCAGVNMFDSLDLFSLSMVFQCVYCCLFGLFKAGHFCIGAVAYLLLHSRVFSAAWSFQAGNGIPACSHLPVQFRPGVALCFIMFTVAC